MWQRLKTGEWLTGERIRAAALASAMVLGAALIYLVASAQGTVDAWGRPLGTDFSNVWTAGRMAMEGRAAQAWDWSLHHQVQQATHGRSDIPFYGWHYPPPFLLVATLLALLPYWVALLVWQGITLGLALRLARSIHPEPLALLVALAAPVTFVCLTHGHNGFLTAALMGGGLLLLDRRPLLAGLLFGCLIYKPQFALIIPPLLILGGHKRAFAGACLAGSALIAATFLAWGWPVWQAFLDSLPLTRTVVVEAGATGWSKIQSPFAWVRMWGGDTGLAYLVQALATGVAVGITLWLTRRGAPALRNAAAASATLLSTPYVLDYDFVLLGIGALFLAADGRERGFLTWEKSGLALVWLSPLFARSLADLASVPLGQISALALLALAARRTWALDPASRRFRSWPFRHSRAASGR